MSVKLDTRVLDKIIAEHPDEASKVVRAGAFAVEGEAKVKAPVDKGALKNSIYTVTAGHNGYSKAKQEVNGARPDAETAPHPQPKNALTAHTGPCVDYAAYQEFGTSKMGAQPYIIPAVEVVRPQWNENWRKFFKRWT